MVGSEDYCCDFVDEPEDYEGRRPDSYFLEAQQRIREIYDRDRASIYYVRQMQIKFEKQYFHWITDNAMVGLVSIGYLKDVRIESETGTSTRYFTHKSNRYATRRIKEMQKLVEEYSDDTITRSCGHRAEDLFCNGLALKGFLPRGKKVTSYGGVKWDKSGHDLDFVFEKDGVAYGCEIKNTLGYIKKDELEIKLQMCEHLRLRPLFIMRSSPKTYNKMIIDKGGFAMIFDMQIYELSQAKLVARLKAELGLPVDCPRAIPEGIPDRFANWHGKAVSVNSDRNSQRGVRKMLSALWLWWRSMNTIMPGALGAIWEALGAVWGILGKASSAVVRRKTLRKNAAR